MAHISSIGAGIFSDLAMHNHTNSSALLMGSSLDGSPVSEFDNAFQVEVDTPTAAPGAGTGTYTRFKNVREYPAMGIPPNIVNVPVYGQKTSQQIQGQADAPQLEIQVNFVGSQWDKATGVLGSKVGDAKQYLFRFAILNSQPTSYASTVGGLGSTENDYWYWVGKIEALVVQPQLTDANTATVTLSIQSAFFGAYTI